MEAIEAIVKIPTILFGEAGTLPGSSWVLALDLEVTLFLHLSVISAGTLSNQDIFFLWWEWG